MDKRRGIGGKIIGEAGAMIATRGEDWTARSRGQVPKRKKWVESTGSQDERCHGHRSNRQKGVGQGIDGEREFRSRGTRATWRTCRNPGVPTRASDPAGGNGSHHAPLPPPTANPRRGLNTHWI